MAHMAPRGSPWRLSLSDWWDALKRAWSQAGTDNVGLVAAGAAFYAFVAIVPTLAATVLTYGLVATPETVQRNIGALFDVLPADAARAIGEQLATVAASSADKQGIGLAIAIALALYGATKGASSMVTALNIAYGLPETRGFIRLNVLALAMVVVAVLLIFTSIATTAVLAFLGGLIPDAPGFVLAAIRILGYLILAAIVVTGAAALYRFAPARVEKRWVWMSPGALGATILWLGGTALFGLYAASFGNYGATYGSLSAVIVLLTWLWLSAYVFLLGAELNEALEYEADPMPAPVEAADAAVPAAIHAPRSGLAGSTAALKTASHATGAKLALPPALLAGAGFARLGRGNAAGAAMIAGAAAWVWLTRKRS